MRVIVVGVDVAQKVAGIELEVQRLARPLCHGLGSRKSGAKILPGIHMEHLQCQAITERETEHIDPTPFARQRISDEFHELQELRARWQPHCLVVGDGLAVGVELGI